MRKAGTVRLVLCIAVLAISATWASGTMADRVIVRPGATDLQWIVSYTGAGGVLGGGGESGWYGFGPNGATPMLADFNGDGIDETCDEHIGIVTAIRQNQAELAEQRMKDHIRKVRVLHEERIRKGDFNLEWIFNAERENPPSSTSED